MKTDKSLVVDYLLKNSGVKKDGLDSEKMDRKVRFLRLSRGIRVQILEMCLENGYISPKMVSEKLGYPIAQASNKLQRLSKNNFLIRFKRGVYKPSKQLLNPFWFSQYQELSINPELGMKKSVHLKNQTRAGLLRHTTKDLK